MWDVATTIMWVVAPTIMSTMGLGCIWSPTPLKVADSGVAECCLIDQDIPLDNDGGDADDGTKPDGVGKDADGGAGPVLFPKVALVSSLEPYSDQSLAFDGSRFLLVFDSKKIGVTEVDIHGVRISASGALLDDTPFLISQKPVWNELWPDVAELDGVFGVLWRCGQTAATLKTEICRARLSHDVSDALQIEHDDAVDFDPVDSDITAPRIGASDHHFMMVWGEDGKVLGVRSFVSGALIESNPIEIADTPGGFPQVTSNGEDYFVIWRTTSSPAQIFGRRVSKEGLVLDGAPQMLAETLNTAYRFRPHLGYGDGEYFVYWAGTGDAIHPANGMYGTRVGVDGAIKAKYIEIASLPVSAASGLAYLDGQYFFSGLIQLGAERGVRTTSAGVPLDDSAAALELDAVVAEPKGVGTPELRRNVAVGASASHFVVASPKAFTFVPKK